MGEERSPKESERKYGDGILIGNWYEDTCQYVLKPQFRCTTYLAEYIPPAYPTYNDPGFIWDCRFNGYGNDPRVTMDHNGFKFHENNSSTYDLAYRVQPKGLDGPRPRTFNVRFKEYRPQQGYLDNYGNITNFGLKDYLKKRWECETKEPPELKSLYQESFEPPDTNDYKFYRYSKPRQNSTSLDPINLQQYTLRGSLCQILPDMIKPCRFKRTCNKFEF